MNFDMGTDNQGFKESSYLFPDSQFCHAEQPQSNLNQLFSLVFNLCRLGLAALRAHKEKTPTLPDWT